MKVTRLQEKLNSYYENSKEKLGENSELLKEAKDILGNRGYSHLKRTEKAREIIEPVYNHLNNAEKKCFDQLLRIDKNYVKTACFEGREIKDIYEVRGEIAALRKNIRPNKLERNVELNEEPVSTETIKINDYIQNPQGNSQNNQKNNEISAAPIQIEDYQRTTQRKKAGHTLRNTLLGIVGAAVIVGGIFGSYVTGKLDGKESQQPKIRAQQSIINSRTREIKNIYEVRKSQEKAIIVYDELIKNKNKEIAEQKTAIAVAGRPDGEVKEETIKNTTRELTTKYNDIIKTVSQNAKDQVNELLKQQSDLEYKLAKAGRPDEEVKKETIKNTTEKLTTKYEKIIKKVNKKAKKQVNELLEQQSDLEEKLIAAGRPDGEVRKEARQNMVEQEKFDSLYSAFEHASDDYEGLKIKHKNLSKKNENLREKYVVLENEKATSDAIGDELAKIVDDYVNGNACQELNKCDETATAPIAPVAVHVADSNNLEQKIADANNIHSNKKENCDICSTIGFEKQQYLKDKPWDYPKRIEKRRKELDKKGNHLGAALSRVGWGLSVLNDAAEGPVRFITGLGGGVLGAGSNIIGNKKDSFDNGWKNGDKFGAYVMDGVFGGNSKNAFDSYLLQLKLKQAIAVPYCMEDTKLGAHGKLAEIIVVDTLPWVWHPLFGSHHGNGASGGIERIGGEVDGGIISSGGPVR